MRYSSLAYAIIAFCLLAAIAPADVSAQTQLQMLPPTSSGTSTICPNANDLLFFSGASGNDSTTGKSISSINCSSSLYIDPPSGRLYSGNQISGGNGGMWVGPNQFVGSLNNSQLGFYDNGVWRVTIHNDGWVTFNNELAQIAGWNVGDGYTYASFGSAWHQQIVLRSDNNAFLFPWTTPGTLNINGNMSITSAGWANDNVNINSNQIWNSGGGLYLNYSTPGDGWVTIGGGSSWQGLSIPRGDLTVGNGNLTVNGNATINGNLNVNGQFCLNGKCMSSLPDSGGVNSLYSVCGYFNDMNSWYQNAGRDNFKTGGKSCPSGTTDVQEMGAYDGSGRVCYLHVCYNN